MADQETGKVNPNPESAKTPANPAADATKYVGTPAVGTSKAAAAGGLAGTAPSTEIDRHRRRFVWTMVTGFLMAWFLAFFRFFLPRTLFEPNSVFKIGYPSEFALGVDTKFQQKYRIWVDRTPDRIFVIYARCTHLGCTPDWKPSENKFKCPCHGRDTTAKESTSKVRRRGPWIGQKSNSPRMDRSSSIPPGCISGLKDSRRTSMIRGHF